MVTRKPKTVISFLSAEFLFLIARANRRQRSVRKKDIWSDKALQFSRKKLLAGLLARNLATGVWQTKSIRKHLR